MASLLTSTDGPQEAPPPHHTAATPAGDLGAHQLHTRISRRIAVAMSLLFLTVVFGLPVAQALYELFDGRQSPLVRLFSAAPSAENLHQFALDLEAQSAARSAAQPHLEPLLSGEAFWRGEVSPRRVVANRAHTPFLQWVRQRNHVMHPLVGFTNVQGVLEGEADYFGFRNPHDLYLPQDQQQVNLVVITGNSEMVGVTHRVPVALRLEQYLNQHSLQQWRVLNLAMNSYTVPYEINAFVNLAHHLKPRVVISHSFPSDMFYGLMAPAAFKRLGLNYYKGEEVWVTRAHGVKPPAGAGEWIVNEAGSEHLVDAYLRNVTKYQAIARTAGSDFILGIQRVAGEQSPKVGESLPVWKLVRPLYAELLAKLPQQQVQFIDFTSVPGIEFEDPIHTTEMSAQLIAEIYGRHILSGLHNASGHPEEEEGPVDGSAALLDRRVDD